MEKNTIWALVLSGIVMFASIFLEVNVVLPKEQAKAEAQAAKQKTEQLEKEAKTVEATKIMPSAEPEETKTVDTTTATVEPEPEAVEKTYTITTNKVKVIFSNKGGDIISYQLLEHKDKQTGRGVEMVDNITPNNRAFAVSFGDAQNSILNETFNVKQIDDYTIGFYRNYIRKDELGKENEIKFAKTVYIQ